jgi:hypothetical protein
MAGEGMTIAGIRRIFILEAEIADLKRQLEASATGSVRRPSATPNSSCRL